jgi:excisionase family DNA binding protein
MANDMPTTPLAGERRLCAVATADSQREYLGAIASLLSRSSSTSDGRSQCSLHGASGEYIDLPDSVIVLLEKLTAALAEGDEVAVVPIPREVTTQEAASLLNVSRQYLVRLLDRGEIPYRRSGTHRRLRVTDVLAYRKQRDARLGALDELSQLTQDLIGYDELRPKT